MKYTVHYTNRFKKSVKRIKQTPSFKTEKLKEIISLLSDGQPLPQNYRDHRLTGNLRTFRECHIAPDILIIYQIDDDVLILTLANIGSHAKLFG